MPRIKEPAQKPSVERYHCASSFLSCNLPFPNAQPCNSLSLKDKHPEQPANSSSHTSPRPRTRPTLTLRILQYALRTLAGGIWRRSVSRCAFLSPFISLECISLISPCFLNYDATTCLEQLNNNTNCSGIRLAENRRPHRQTPSALSQHQRHSWVDQTKYSSPAGRSAGRHGAHESSGSAHRRWKRTRTRRTEKKRKINSKGEMKIGEKTWKSKRTPSILTLKHGPSFSPAQFRCLSNSRVIKRRWGMRYFIWRGWRSGWGVRCGWSCSRARVSSKRERDWTWMAREADQWKAKARKSLSSTLRKWRRGRNSKVEDGFLEVRCSSLFTSQPVFNPTAS